MSSSRSSSRIQKRRGTFVRPKDASQEISEAAIAKIGEASTQSPEEFTEAFHGLSPKHFESFFKGMTPSQSSTWWPAWINFFEDSDSVRLNIFLNLLRSAPVEPLGKLLGKLNPLLSSKEHSEQIKQSISLLCDKLMKQVDCNASFTSHLLSYLLTKNQENFSPNIAKRIFSVLNAFPAYEPSLRPLVSQAIANKAYYLNKEGVKVLGLLVLKSEHDFGLAIHGLTRSLLPGMALDVVLNIGELYKKIWLKSGDRRETFQVDVIQDLMYHGLKGKRNLPPEDAIVPQIIRLLDPFHTDKSNKEIQAMLCHIWEPILWRYLKAANPQVRCNAAEFLFRAFPVENPFLNLEERVQTYEDQIKVMKDLLLDSEASVRLIAVRGVSTVLASYWAFLTSDAISELVGILVKTSSRDADSVQSRIAVLDGLVEVLRDAPASHAYLKTLLPKTRDSLLDVNESVRLAMLELLSAVKNVKYISYWDICPLEDLLHRLASDTSPAVCRRIVKLIFNSFFPAKDSDSVKLERCIFLIGKNPGAAKRFYEHSLKFMKLFDAVKFMLSILVSFKRHLRMLPDESQMEEDEEEDSTSDKENVAQAGSENLSGNESNMMTDTTAATSIREGEMDSFYSDFDIMHNFLDIITIMWISRYEELIKTENAANLAVLESKTTKIMTSMFRIYKGTDMAQKIIYICSLFSQSSVNTIVRHCLNNLKNTEFRDFEVKDRLYRESVVQSWRGQLISKEPEEYSIFIDALCNWKKGQDLLEFVLYGIEKGLENLSKDLPPLAQLAKRRKSVRFVERDQNVHLRSIYFLSYIFRHSINKQRVMSKHMKELQVIYAELSKVRSVIEAELACPMFSEDGCTQEYLYFTWETYLKSVLIIEDSQETISSIALQGLSTMSTSSQSKLKYPLLKAFILFLSNAFTLSKVPGRNKELTAEIIARIPSWCSSEEEGFELSYLSLSLLGEMFEWSLYMPEGFELPELHQDIITCLKELITTLRVAATPISPPILHDFKSVLGSFLESVRLYSQSSTNSFYNFLKHVSHVIVKEIQGSIPVDAENSEVELPKAEKLKDLPGVSCLLLNSLCPKFIKYFLEELRISLQLQSLKHKEEVYSVLCFLHPLALDKDLSVSKNSLGDCLAQLEDLPLLPQALELMKSIREQVKSPTTNPLLSV